jgi:hypothetical protein
MSMNLTPPTYVGSTDEDTLTPPAPPPLSQFSQSDLAIFDNMNSDKIENELSQNTLAVFDDEYDEEKRKRAESSGKAGGSSS